MPSNKVWMWIKKIHYLVFRILFLIFFILLMLGWKRVYSLDGSWVHKRGILTATLSIGRATKFRCKCTTRERESHAMVMQSVCMGGINLQSPLINLSFVAFMHAYTHKNQHTYWNNFTFLFFYNKDNFLFLFKKKKQRIPLKSQR